MSIARNRSVNHEDTTCVSSKWLSKEKDFGHFVRMSEYFKMGVQEIK